jgi:ATP-binding cassette subfamily B protein
MVVTEFAVMYFALTAWQRGELSVGGVVLLQAYFLRLFDKLWDAGSNIRAVYEALADANEMTELLVHQHGIKDAPAADLLTGVKGAVTFDAVTFGYHSGAAVLKDFNLSIKAGERVALVGPSGGGKSTILKLIMRLYDIQQGSIRIDGKDISTVTQDSLRAALSFVPQDPILFHRSLAENIRYAKPDATDEEVIAAARLAHAHEFIERSQHGYQTLVGERGIKLSGGERQRIAIARALLKNAPILILDEATSSLDSESEMLIQDALHTLMAGRTTIVVAHRLSTIMQMDRIVVISGGGILEEGTHEELLKEHQGTYQKLWNIQAGGFTTEPVAQ